MMDGVLIVDKPEGVTSADVVRVVKRRLRCKTGHLGTLDPFASGVLPLCVGEGTKIAQFLNAADKQYTGLIRLGDATDTGDPTGRVISTAPVPPLDAAALERAGARFLGDTMQLPPMYSAIKRDGTPLYKLARQGVEVERQPRRVRIEAIMLTRADATQIGFSVTCSKGTYVRVLAQDIALTLGSVGHLATLRRTRFGPFREDDAVSLARPEDEPFHVIGMRDALGHLREIELAAADVRRARQGYAPLLGLLAPGALNEAAKLVGPDGQLAAVIAMDRQRGWRFVRVFGES